MGHAAPGDAILVRAASSSVGLAAIQLANWAGAEPIAATRTGAKTSALKAQGTNHVIATQESNLVSEVQRITAGRGARIIFSTLAGSVEGAVAARLGRLHDLEQARAIRALPDLILHGLAEGRLKPVIAKTFPLSDIVAAHRYLESNQQLGKIVVTV